MIGIILLSCVLLSGCTILTPGKPNLPRIYRSPELPQEVGKRPLIVIPGILGSRLVNNKTGQVVWPKFIGTTSDLIALPITSANLEENRDDLSATEIVDRAKFFRFSPEISFYDTLFTALETAGGYKHGNIDDPPSDGDHDIYYVFAYDWRRDNVESARLLMRKILVLKEKLKRPDLQFDVIGHSMGGLVARYGLMYGDQDVLSQKNPTPDWRGAKHIARLLMFGTPNAGSMDALSTLINGYSVLGTNWPQLKLLSALDRDAVFTTPSIYQLLPHQGAEKFYDEQLNPLPIDLYDVATWKKYHWSIAYETEFREREMKRFLAEKKRLKKQKSPEAETKLGELEEHLNRLIAAREPFLAAALARAKTFHAVMDVPNPPPPSVRFYLFGGDCDSTLEAAVITNLKNQLLTFFRVKRAMGKADFRRKAAELMFAPGDTRVTRHSLFGLLATGPHEELVSFLPPAQQVTFHCESHGDLLLNPTLQDNLLAVLLGPRH